MHEFSFYYEILCIYEIVCVCIPDSFPPLHSINTVSYINRLSVTPHILGINKTQLLYKV